MTEHDNLSQTLFIFGLIKYVQLTLLHCIIVSEFRRYSPLSTEGLSMLKTFTAISSCLPGYVGEVRKSGSFTLCVTRSSFSVMTDASARPPTHDTCSRCNAASMSYVSPRKVHRMCTPSCRRNRVLFRPPTCRHVMTRGIARTRSVMRRLTASQPPPALS